MEESKSESNPEELSKSIYHLITGSEPKPLGHILEKENSKNVQELSNSPSSAYKEYDNSHIFEGLFPEIKSKSIKDIDSEDNETTLHKSLPILYTLHNSEISTAVQDSTDNKKNYTEDLRTSRSPTTECINDQESSSTINNSFSPEISNVRSAHSTVYSLTSERLPMADLFSQYHVVSQHGYNTSTSSINTCDTRSSTPTFQSHVSVLTGASDSDMYFDSEVDLDLKGNDEHGQIKKDKYSRKRSVYGSYDVKPHSVDSILNTDVAFENVMLTSLRSFENSFEIGCENGEQKLEPHAPSPSVHKPASPEPPPLPASPPPRTPPSTLMLQTSETKGGNFTCATQINGNHVVQNMSNEMYKTMKKAIKPGKVNELKKIFADFFYHEQDIQNVFSPMQHQQIQNQVKAVDNFGSGDTQSDFSDNEARIEITEKSTGQIDNEKNNKEGTETADKEENPVFYAEDDNPMQFIVKPETKSKQDQIQLLENEKQECQQLQQQQEQQQDHHHHRQQQQLLQKLQAQHLKVQPVKNLLSKTVSNETDYFADVEARSIGNSDLTYSTPDWSVTNSYTQKDLVLISNTIAITTTKPTIVITTSTVNKVSENKNEVSKEIKPTSAPPLLPPVKTDFTETNTIWKSEKEAGLLQEAELSRKKENELEEERAKPKKKRENEQEIVIKERNEEKEGQEWEEVQSKVDLNSVCVEQESSSAVVVKESEEKKIDEKKKRRENIGGKEKEIKNNNEEDKNKMWNKIEEKTQGAQNREKHYGEYEKQLENLEVDVRKETENSTDIIDRKTDDKSDLNKQETQGELNASSDTALSCSPSHKPNLILLDKTSDSLEKSLTNEDKVKSETDKSTLTTCVQTFSYSQAGHCETFTTAATIGPATATTASSEASQVSDTPRLANSSAFAGYNNSSSVLATADEIINSPCVAVLTRQTSATDEILKTVSQVVNLTSTTVSPVTDLPSFPTIKVSKGLLSHDGVCGSENSQVEFASSEDDNENVKHLLKPQPEIKGYKPLVKKLNEDINDDNDDGKENKESKRINAKEIEKNELVSWEKNTEFTKENEIKKRSENEIKDNNKQSKESIQKGTKTLSAVRRSNSAVVPAKKVYQLSRTQSMDKLKARPLTVDSASVNCNESFTGTIYPFNVLRQMFEEGRPLKREDDEKDLPSPIKTSAYPTNFYAADRSNTEQAKSVLYPLALPKESYLTRQTPSLTAKSRDVYLSKQSAAKINKIKATCKTATTTTNRTTTASSITGNINQLSPNVSTSSSLSSATRDGWSGRTTVKKTVQNENIDSSVVSSSNLGNAGFSTSHFAEMPLELETITKSDSYTTFKTDGHVTGSKDLTVTKPAKTFAIKGNNKILQSSKSKTLKQNNNSQSSMDPRNEHRHVSNKNDNSLPIRAHLAETDDWTEEVVQSSNMSAVETFSFDDSSTEINRKVTKIKTTENENVHSMSVVVGSNRYEDISQIPQSTNRDSNKYVSEIGINSAHSVPESARNILLLGTKEEFMAQNDIQKATDNIIMETNFVPVNMYQLDNNFGSMISSNTTLTPNLPISASILTPVIPTVITDVHLAPLQSAAVNDVNRGQSTHMNILSTNELQTVIGTQPPQLTPAQLLNEVNVDRNITLNEAISTTAYNVGVDSVSQNTLSNNNDGITMGSLSVSSPRIQYYTDSQSSTDAWQTTLNSTTLYTTLAPVATGLTSSEQCGLSTTWNVGIPIPVTMTTRTHHDHDHHHYQQDVMQQDLISSPTPSSLYVGRREGTEKLEDETSTHIQGNVFRRIVEFEKTPEHLNFEKQKSHNFHSGKTTDILENQEEDAETTYERVKRSLRPIPQKDDNYLNLKWSAKTNPDSSMDDSSHIHDMSSLRSSQTPSYYSVNESIGSFTEDNEEQNVTNEDQNAANKISSDHQYAVVRLTPSNTDYNKVKHTIYCEVGGSGIKNETSSSPSFNLMRQRSSLSNVSFSTPSTVASDTEDELSDANDARLEKQNFRNTNRTIHKSTASVSKQRTATDITEKDSMKKNTYKTEKNIFLNSTQPSKIENYNSHHASEMAIDSGTGTEIISSEGEVEGQEITETWYEYEKIPYEKYEKISKSDQNISMDTTATSLWSSPNLLSASSFSAAAVTTTTTTTTAAAEPTTIHYQMNTQASEFTKPTPPKNFDISRTSSLSKSDSNQIYEVHTEPETVSQEGEEDLRIIRGRLLIKNTIDSPKDGDDFDDNINVFAEEFHLDKENPLYQSDPDIYKHTEEEDENWPEDITFDQVDSMAKNHKISTEVMKTEVRGKQKLSNLLLSRLSNLDSKDIKQSINVEHHHEEIYGDIDFIHADGTKASSDYTENFDSIAENVELLMKSGKAVIVIKVIAERIVPIDYEFNVWRKSSATVTRQIELDLLANEQRKRLYNHVMENAGGRQTIEPKKYGSYLERTQGSQETVLNSRETFRLFNQLLTVAENSGEGGDQNEIYSEKTEQLALQRPSISDFMY